jgi:hypothetical protein
MKINLPDPPCKDCICRPMCKPVIEDNPGLVITPLLKKCSLLSDYVYGSEMFMYLKLSNANKVIRGEK